MQEFNSADSSLCSLSLLNESELVLWDSFLTSVVDSPIESSLTASQIDPDLPLIFGCESTLPPFDHAPLNLPYGTIELDPTQLFHSPLAFQSQPPMNHSYATYQFQPKNKTLPLFYPKLENPHASQATPLPTPDIPRKILLTEEEKRLNHIASEKKRRESIKNGYRELESLMPHLRTPAKNAVLCGAVELIKSLEAENAMLLEQIQSAS